MAAGAHTVTVENAGGYWRGRFEAMASPCEVLCEADTAAAARSLTRTAAREAWRIEAKFSRYRPANIVHRLNSAAGKPVEVDAETSQLIDFAETLYDLSNGRFDITSGVLREVWVFDGSDRVPAAQAVSAVLARVLTLPAGMEIDFGGIGKEFAVDRAVMLLREATTRSCLVNFGGDLAVTGRPERRSSWSVGIEAVSGNPAVPSNRLRLASGALATSGDARRYLLKAGQRYGHILDPRTGWPVSDAPRSVTVAADTCTQAGMLSTLAMLEGEGAERFLDAQDVSYWCDRGNPVSRGREGSRAGARQS
jgi:thiamine biosynthesis lipoprotein